MLSHFAILDHISDLFIRDEHKKYAINIIINKETRCALSFQK